MSALVLSSVVAGALWLWMLTHRVHAARGSARVLFRGAPPRFGGLDVLVLGLLLVGFASQPHPLRTTDPGVDSGVDHGPRCPDCGRSLSSHDPRSPDARSRSVPLPHAAALAQGLAVSLMVLRALRWARERRALGVPADAELSQWGHLVSVRGESGWTALASRNPVHLGPRLDEAERDYRGRAGAVRGEGSRRAEPLATTWRLEPTRLTGATERVGPGPGIFALAALVGLVAAVIVAELVVAPLAFAAALAVFGRVARPVAAPAQVLVLEHAAQGLDRWLPLVVSCVATVVALALDVHLLAISGWVGAGLLALAFTFVSDRLSRLGVVSLGGSGPTLTLHGTTLPLLGAVSNGPTVVLQNPLGSLVVTGLGSHGRHGSEIASGLAIAVGVPRAASTPASTPATARADDPRALQVKLASEVDSEEASNDGARTRAERT